MSDDNLLLGLFVMLLAAGVPWYLFLLAILRRHMSRRLATWMSGGLTVLPFLLLALSGAVWLFLHYPQREFSPTYWAAHESERYAMCQELIGSRQLVGQSKTQVRRLLGEPFPTYSPEANELLYEVGYPPSLTTYVRPALLVVKFHEGQVTEVESTLSRLD